MKFSQATLPQRQDHIKQLRNSGSGIYQFQETFQGIVQKFDVYAVDINFPCYRLANGRTRAAQKEVIATKGLAPDFFSDPDSEAALMEQDSILRSMASEAGLLTILKKHKQDRPLILDNNGYVVNGNRRLCAMRLLLSEDETAYEHFKHVQVVFLPPCSERDIRELEGRLQVQPEGRAEYSWVVEAMLYRELREQGWNDEEIASLYEQRLSDVRELIAMLEDADDYLQSRGKPGQYSKVLKHKYAFGQLQKIRKKCGDDEPRKQLIWALSCIMLDDPDTQGRLYESIPDTYKYLDPIVENIKVEFADQISSLKKDEEELDILGGVIVTPYDGAAEILRKTENEAGARAVIKDVIEEKRAQERERKDSLYCIKQVQQAHTKLVSALNSLDENADLDGIHLTLINIEEAVSNIRTWLNNVANQN